MHAHQDKYGLLLIGTEKFRENSIKKTPIFLDKFQLQTKSCEKYPGQLIKSDLASNALATVQDRQAKIKGAAMEIKCIIEDFNMQAMCGLVAAWELWERALIPSLLSGDIKEAVKHANQIQFFIGA